MPPDERLTAEQIRLRAVEIREELERLLARRAVAARPNARQWQFLRHCLQALTTGRSAAFPCDTAKAAQYRFEVDQGLARHYAMKGQPIKFLFELRHGARAMREGTIDEHYPQSNGYVLLVSDVRAPYLTTSERETRALLERVVADAMDAEFAVYRALPKIDLSPLKGVFVVGAPAYKRIQHLAEQHHRRRWTIANHNNPSTRRLMAIKDIELLGDEAKVRTEEYWYLRWWSIRERKNTHVYCQRSFQRYILVRDKDRWLVEHNIYPPPRGSAARRRWY